MKKSTDAAGDQQDVILTMDFLVVKDFKDGSVWAYAVDAKGACGDEWVIRQLLRDIDDCGVNLDGLVIKCDQENAIKDVQEEFIRRRKDDMNLGSVREHSRVGDSNSNGRTERAVQEVCGMVRTLRIAIELETSRHIGVKHPIVPWMVRQAGQLVTQTTVRSNGRTAYENIKGYHSVTPVAEFGESVIFLHLKTKKSPGKFEDKWREGVWLGVTLTSGESIVGTPEGVFRAGAIHRNADSDKWSQARIDAIRGTPREPTPGAVSDIIKVYVQPEIQAASKAAMPSSIPQPLPETQVRRMRITQQDVLSHGPTDGCHACRDIVLKKERGGQGHSEACRIRLEAIIEDTEEGKIRVERANLRITQAILDMSVKNK